MNLVSIQRSGMIKQIGRLWIKIIKFDEKKIICEDILLYALERADISNI